MAFRASDRQLSTFHPQRVEEAGYMLRDLRVGRLGGAGEAHLKVETCISLGEGISTEFNPRVYWRPDKIGEAWEDWKEAHAQIESMGGNAGFPTSYRSLLAENAICLEPPDIV